MGRPWRGWVPTTPSTSTVSVTTPSTLPGFRCHCRSISGPRPWNSCRASSPTVCELVEGILTVLQDPLVATLDAFGVYAVGFVARPGGAAIFGHFGDRIGR